MQAPAPRPRPSRLASLAPQGEELKRQQARLVLFARYPALISSSWPGLSRPSTSLTRDGLKKTWMPATSAGMTDGVYVLLVNPLSARASKNAGIMPTTTAQVVAKANVRYISLQDGVERSRW